MARFIPLLQVVTAVLLALVAGSVFGIWRGYDPTSYSAATFLEVHRGAVDGLNVVLPSLGLATMVLTVALIWLVRGSGPSVWLYLGALLLMLAGGLVTRFGNQPINAEVIGWTMDALPADWNEVRATWWTWHLWRTATTILGLVLLLTGIVVNRAMPR